MNLRACLLLALLPLAAASAEPAARFTTLFGERIRYYDVGAGPTVVLLHGLGSSAWGDWGHCIGPLAVHHRVLALDQLGWGGSDKPFIDYSIQTWVDFLGEFLRQRQVGHFTLVGESLGGWIAAQYAIQALSGQPAPAGPSFVLPKPDRLVLCDAAGHRAGAEQLLEGGGDSYTIAGAKSLLAKVFHSPAYATDAAVRADLAWAMSKGDSWTVHSFSSNRHIVAEAVDGKLSAITVPTLIIWGAYDELVPLAEGRDYAAKIPGARLVIIPDAAHAACIEKPESFLAALTSAGGIPP